MLIGWDADGHVEESEETFSDKYFDPKYRDRRPEVVQSDRSGTLWWVTDDLLFPRRVGPFQQVGMTPASKGGVASKQHAAKKYDPVESAELRSAADRIRQLDDEHIDVQVNYPTMFLSWPITADPGLGAALARSYNNWQADITSQAPDRLKWVTVIDMGDPKAAAKEIERTKELGSSGVMLLGTAGDKPIDDESMEPVWAAAAETGLPVAMHVGFSSPSLGNMYGFYERGTIDSLLIPFTFSLLMGFQRVVYSGLLDRYPNLRVAFLEAGCSWVEFMVDRMTEYCGKPGTRLMDPRITLPGLGIASAAYRSELLPKEYIQRGQLFFGFEVDEEMVPRFIEEFGADCLLYASDIPHFDRFYDAVSLFQERTDLSDEVKRKMLVDNAARFYGLPVPAPAAPAATA